jgi:hypothetical protein
MDLLVILAIASLMGLISVDMFSRAWKGFLGLVASFILYFKGSICSKCLLVRLNYYFALCVMCSLTLTLCFHLYLARFRLGTTEAEQMLYFLAAMIRMVFFLRNVNLDIDLLFDWRPENNE